MKLIWLLLVLISFHNVTADPPALLSAEYTVKAYQSLDAGRQVAVLTGTFDQDVYANASCTSSATKTIYTRCCTNEIQTDCYRSVNPNNQCIDSQTSVRAASPRSQGKTFEFHVKNYELCDSVIFLARALIGDPDVLVSIQLSNTNPSLSSYDYKREEIGSDAFLQCCSSILQKNPNWNGSVFVTVQSRTYSDAYYDALVHDDPARLSVTDFWWLSPVQIECPSSNQTFTTRACQYSELCMFFPPSDDPLFIYLSTVTSRIFYGIGTMVDYNPRQISLGLVTKLVDLRFDPNVKYFPFPIELLSDPDCKVSFPTVMNMQGQRSSNSRPFTPRPLSCTLERFSNVTRGIENVITSLKTSNHTVQAVVDDHMYRADAYTISNPWIGCVEMVQRELLDDRQDLTYINQTRFCYATSSTSQEYLDDPCCNRLLRNRMCCAPRDVSTDITRYSMNNGTINARCNHPSCVRQSLEDFIVLAESTGDIFSGCSKNSFAALTDPIFTKDPWATCAATIYQTTCSSNLECQSKLSVENSLCLGTGYCSIPCTSDDACGTGSCISVQNQRTCLLYNQNITADSLAAADSMLTCLHNNLAPFATAFIRQELNLPISASSIEFKKRFGEALTGDTCLGVGSVTDAQRTNQSLCLAPNSCNWAQCTDNSSPNMCTRDNCMDSALSPAYCQACFGSNCREVSSTQTCSYYTITDAQSCDVVNGHFNPLRPEQQPCIAKNSTAESCFPPTLCSEEQRTNNTCVPVCYVPSITDEDGCVNARIGTMQLTWTNWTVDFVPYGLCSDATINSRQQCDNASAGLATWWPGTQFTHENLLTQVECESVGYCSPSGRDTYKDVCLRTYYCDGCPTCTTQESCVASGQCNNPLGCYKGFNDDGSCPKDVTWTPEGCFYGSWSESQCAAENGRWVTKRYQDRASCYAAGSACVETVQLRGYWRTGGVTYKNETECIECNGQWQSVYQFQEGRWRPSQFTPYSWTTRNFTTANTWTKVLNSNLFYAMYRRAAARRYANILTTNIYCRYSKLISSLTPLACDCGEDRQANEACFASITQSVMSVIQACNNVPTVFNVRLGNVTIDQSFESRSSDCMDIPVSEVPQKQFLQRHLPTLSSVTVSLSQAGKAAQVRFIRNEHGVAVGELVGDGLNISPPTTDFTGTIQVCLMLANLTGSGDMDIRVLDLATPNEAWNHFTPLGLNLTFTDTMACTEVPQTGLVIFPVGLIADWESAIFIQTLQLGEILVIYLGSGLYLLVLAMTIYQMHHHIKEHMHQRTKKFFKVGRLGLMILIVVLIDRFLYLMLLPNGILEQSRVADVLFSELPAMFYLCIYSLIVLRWAEICHFTMTLNTGSSFNKLMPVVIAVNSFIAVAFVVLLVMFLVQPDNVNDVLSCASNFELQMTTAETLAIVYRVVFSAFCLTFSILFAVYGAKIMRMIHESNKLALEIGAKDKVRQRNRKITTLIVISLACTLCLLAQSACLLWISFNSAVGRSVIGVLVFFYVVELGPAIIFIFLFKSTSIFAKFSRRKGWKKRSTEGGGTASHSYQQLTAQPKKSQSVNSKTDRIKDTTNPDKNGYNNEG